MGEKMRDTTGGVAWKQDVKEYVRKKCTRPTHSLELTEYRVMYEFFVNLLRYARDHHEVKRMDQNWDDTRTAVNTKLHFIQMSDEEILDKAKAITLQLDEQPGFSKPEEILFMTEMDW